jgi:hypothetical protein
LFMEPIDLPHFAPNFCHKMAMFTYLAWNNC